MHVISSASRVHSWFPQQPLDWGFLELGCHKGKITIKPSHMTISIIFPWWQVNLPMCPAAFHNGTQHPLPGSWEGQRTGPHHIPVCPPASGTECTQLRTMDVGERAASTQLSVTDPGSSLCPPFSPSSDPSCLGACLPKDPSEGQAPQGEVPQAVTGWLRGVWTGGPWKPHCAFTMCQEVSCFLLEIIQQGGKNP